MSSHNGSKVTSTSRSIEDFRGFPVEEMYQKSGTSKRRDFPVEEKSQKSSTSRGRREQLEIRRRILEKELELLQLQIGLQAKKKTEVKAEHAARLEESKEKLPEDLELFQRQEYLMVTNDKLERNKKKIATKLEDMKIELETQRQKVYELETQRQKIYELEKRQKNFIKIPTEKIQISEHLMEKEVAEREKENRGLYLSLRWDEANVKTEEIIEGEDSWETSLLWKTHVKSLPKNMSNAIRRLYYSEGKMKNDPHFAEAYSKKTEEFVDKGYARKLIKEEKGTSRNRCLPEGERKIIELKKKHRNQIVEENNKQYELERHFMEENKTNKNLLAKQNKEKLLTLKTEFQTLQKTYEESLDTLREENNAIRKQIDEKNAEVKEVKHKTCKLKNDYEAKEMKLKEQLQNVKSENRKLKQKLKKTRGGAMSLYSHNNGTTFRGAQKELTQTIDQDLLNRELVKKKSEKTSDTQVKKKLKEKIEKLTRRIGDSWEAGVLWRENVIVTNSKPTALQILRNIEKKMEKREVFKKQYESKVKEEKASLLLTNFSLLINESESPQNLEEIGVTAGKRMKKAKRYVNTKLRKSIEEQRKQELISNDERKSEQNQETSSKKKENNHKKMEKVENEETTVIISEAETEPKKEPEPEPKPKQKKHKTHKGKILCLFEINLKQVEVLNASEEDPGRVRQSRRIVQLKIKEAKKRNLEEEMVHGHRKKKSKNPDYKDYKMEKQKAKSKMTVASLAKKIIPKIILIRSKRVRKKAQEKAQEVIRRIPTLTKRTKWFADKMNYLKVDDLVIMMDGSLPRNNWPMGRVVVIHPGKDGKVRVVDIKTKIGTFRRPVTKLCPLSTLNS